jgi:uncharacterized protein (TIGR00255 family)
MIQSMTGYGKGVVQLPSRKITVEIKSLNSKNLDVHVRMPSSYREKELDLRDIIAGRLQRGKVDFSLYIEITGQETNSSVNQVVVKEYMRQLAEIAPGTPSELMQMALRLPDTLSSERDEIDEGEYHEILKAVEEALEAVVDYRATEGKALEADFIIRIENISGLLDQVIAIDPERIENVRQRLDRAVAELKEEVDQNRFEQELMYYLEKYDITEEKVRLKNHLEYFAKTLATDDSNGKKLGFITQEIGREINTIGSKSNFAPMQQLVVQMKDELEKIKEQALNVL